jgi:hypothetical protein
MTLQDLLNGVHAVFAYLPSVDEFEFLGSSFTTSLDKRIFLVTAGHVIDGRALQELCFLDAAGQLKSLSFKAVDLPKSKDWQEDLAILEIDISTLTPDHLRALNIRRLDWQRARDFNALPRTAVLLTKGYPSEKRQVDENNLVLTNIPFMTDGRYPRPEKDEPGISRVIYYKDASPVVLSHEGMCGSPWFVADCPEEEWEGMLAGVHVAGGGTPGEADSEGLFIRAEVLIERLSKM